MLFHKQFSLRPEIPILEGLYNIHCVWAISPSSPILLNSLIDSTLLFRVCWSAAADLTRPEGIVFNLVGTSVFKLINVIRKGQLC